MAQIRVLDPTVWRAIELPSGHRVVPGAALETTNAVLRSIDNARVLAPLVASGCVELTFDPDPDEGLVSALVSISEETNQNPPKTGPDLGSKPDPLTNPPENKAGVEGAIPAPSDDPSGSKDLTAPRK